MDQTHDKATPQDASAAPTIKGPLAFLKNAGLFFAAPFVALAYAAAMPFVCGMMLLRMVKER